jgi:hypothetical protein
MAQTLELQRLSGSTNGRGIKVTGTGTGSTVTVHTASSTSGVVDMVTLYAQNDDADGETRTLTVEWGGTTDPDDLIVVPVPCKVGPVLVAWQLPISGGLVVKAFCDEANDCVLFGSVVRVTTT